MSLFSFAGHTLDLIQGRLRNGAEEVMLRPKSLALLTYLLRNPGRVIGKEELILAVWPDVVVSDDSLSQCVKDIRIALGPQGEGLIRTVPRRGFILDEQRVEQASGPTRVGPPEVRTPSVAVLAFDTTPDQEWFSDGIAEDITTALAKSRQLRIVSKNYSFSFRNSARRGDEIARELEVTHLLEGSVRLAGDRTRVSIRLLVGATGELLWAERFDRRVADIFAIQDEITDAVVGHLELELLPEERRAIRQTRTNSLEAYNYELRARQLALVLTKSYLVPARRMYGKAAELDPGYARAYAGMATCDCYLRDWHGEAISAEAMLQTAEKAIELDPGLAEAHAARGFALFCNERHAEAAQAHQMALSIDPHSYEANYFYAMSMARMSEDRERTAELFKLTSRLRSDDYASPMMVSSFLPRGSAEKSEWAMLAVERATRASELHPENAAPLHRGAVALAHLGETEKAYAWLGRALVIDPDDFIGHINAACVYALLGDPERAMDHIETAVRDVPQNTLDIMRNDPDFEALRPLPRFQRLVRRR
ncbi:winged helix-turn-helix domain-containing protein [Devosia sp.]|uniref:winged helix-turn-helix domain-containing tetratricopeptide repeat protein n=1 Tax=Devosia sp. TaxID=1871048 RepID=UPI001B2C33A2|nr:winged helix-turn-helix domain-containing protein [Devosia sp.]MBO9587177.1 winged helix-turn-helix domain-containing protein [Devosia sp.]